MTIKFNEYDNFLFWKNEFCSSVITIKNSDGSSNLVNSSDKKPYNEFYDYKNSKYLTAKECGFNFDDKTLDLISSKIALGMSESFIVKLRSRSIFQSVEFWNYLIDFSLDVIINLIDEILLSFKEMGKFTFTDIFKQDELREELYYKYNYLNHGDFKPRSFFGGIDYKDRVYI